MTDKLIKRTPCIGVCSTTYGDDICRGCRRFRHEITSWIEYTDSEKSIINRRLEKFKIIVLEEKFTVINPDAFKEALLQAKIRFNQDLQPICWIFDLFRSLNAENLNLEDFSLKVKKDFISTPVPQLKEDVNKEFYELSLAHYQRYIKPSFFT
ncbi:MAG: hypothetical protein CMQ57_03625 [Gammaproteobacteria bacterium]|jgi:predicted Fe-S protein YdhL (DUF1289 family)|nr:hypothetical protein [Gammaproteobacteria bacterium]